MDIRICNEHEVDDTRLAALYDEVLAPSFPPSELVTRVEFLDAVTDPVSDTCAFVALDATGEVVGGIVGEWFAECRVLLASYVAVAPGLRGGGIGRRLITESLTRWWSRFSPLLIVGEVEDPRVHPATEYGDPVARLRLYDGLGALILPVPYFQPALHKDADRVRGLLLMVFAASPADRSDGYVDASVVRGFLEQNLLACEGRIDPDDEEIGALRAAVDRADRIPMLAPRQYLA
ncbi:GNAT family N-acetyltransferase [Rhodococcus aetherivorans]|uniref:GNAT family N-acetyltransferase n=1 Tax=Rhodococcus aetherivorans TaxID=191292 RepID=UPI00366C71FB